MALITNTCNNAIHVICNSNDSIAAAIHAGLTTPEHVAAWLGKLAEYYPHEQYGTPDAVVVERRKWYAECNGREIECYECDSGSETAYRYALSQCWKENTVTYWLNIQVWRLAINLEGNEQRVDQQAIRIAIHPREPECTNHAGHGWESLRQVVEGFKQDPLISDHESDIKVRAICPHCGCERQINVGAEDGENDEGMLKVIRYTKGEYNNSTRNN